MTATNEIDRVRDLVIPILSDLDLDLYDVERRSGTIRITVDTPEGSDEGVTLDNLSLATRLISRELDHSDPIPGRYTLEVTSPGLERTLRTAPHFRRQIGNQITVRVVGHAVGPGEGRRFDGELVAADDDGFTVRSPDGSERSIAYADVDKARTVYDWTPPPKPGKGPSQRSRRTTEPTRSGGDRVDATSSVGASNHDIHTEHEQGSSS